MKSARDIRRHYKSLLGREEWREFSRQTIDVCDGLCWACGSDDNLQVHHLVYRDVLPWEYMANEVRVLCRECHESLHQVADLIWVAALRFEPHMLEILLKRIKSAQHTVDNSQDIAIDMENLCHQITRGTWGAEL